MNRNKAVRNFHKALQDALIEVNKNWTNKVFRVLANAGKDVDFPIAAFTHVANSETSAFEGKAVDYYTYSVTFYGKDLNELADDIDSLLANLNRGYFVNDNYVGEGWDETLEVYYITYQFGARYGIR